MKFSCESCGKKYATAETPAPGRVYKIKCKACGHLIVVKASASVQQTATTELRPPTSPGVPAVRPAAHTPPPGLNLEVAAPEPAASGPALDPLPPEPTDPGIALRGPANGSFAGIPQHPDATQEISVAGLSLAPSEPEPPPAEPPPQAAPPPPPEAAPSAGGYVDIFDEPKGEHPAPSDDPFMAAARASLPAGYGQNGTAPDPFAPLREELRTPAPQPASGAPAGPAAPKVPVIAKPPQQKSTGPIVLIAAGGLVLVGILAFVLLGGKKAPAPPPPPAQVQVQAPPAAPPPAVAPPAPEAPPPPPVAAAAAPAEKPAAKPEKRATATSDEDRRAREEKRQREREAKEARDRETREARERDRVAREAKAREDREAREREKATRDARAREEREARDRDRQRREQEKVAAAGLGEAEGGLTQDQIQKVLSSTRKAFEGCIVSSGKSGEVKLDGRRVMMRLNIQTNGAVTYPTLDDVTLNGTELGSCLKSAARLMVFPKFKGDTMHVEVPLVLAGGR